LATMARDLRRPTTDRKMATGAFLEGNPSEEEAQ
jgi:hypothetical protein